MALRKFNGKKYQIAKRTRRGEVCSKPIVELPVEIKTVTEVPVVKPAPKKRAKKSTK
tara:strand:- start:218 stop:388 length:171 start_codon:yes stop_codon:yes gene_type:complete